MLAALPTRLVSSSRRRSRRMQCQWIGQNLGAKEHTVSLARIRLTCQTLRSHWATEKVALCQPCPKSGTLNKLHPCAETSLCPRRIAVDGGARWFEPVTYLCWCLTGSNRVHKQFHISNVILNSLVILKLQHIYRNRKVESYFINFFVRFLQGAFSKRICGSVSCDSNSCYDSIRGDFLESLALLLQLLNYFATVFYWSLVVLNQASFIELTRPFREIARWLGGIQASRSCQRVRSPNFCTKYRILLATVKPESLARSTPPRFLRWRGGHSWWNRQSQGRVAKTQSRCFFLCARGGG